MFDSEGFSKLNDLIYGQELKMILAFREKSPEKKIKKTKKDRELEKNGPIFKLIQSQKQTEQRQQLTTSESIVIDSQPQIIEIEDEENSPIISANKSNDSGFNDSQNDLFVNCDVEQQKSDLNQNNQIEDKNKTSEENNSENIEDEENQNNSDVESVSANHESNVISSLLKSNATVVNVNVNPNLISHDNTDEENSENDNEMHIESSTEKTTIKPNNNKENQKKSTSKRRKLKDSDEIEIVDGRLDRIRRIQRGNYINKVYSESRKAAHQRENEKLRHVPPSAKKRKEYNETTKWFRNVIRNIDNKINTEIAKGLRSNHDRVKELELLKRDTEDEKGLFNVLRIMLPMQEQRLLDIRKFEGYKWREVIRDFIKFECAIDMTLFRTAVESKLPANDELRQKLEKAIQDKQYWDDVFEVNRFRRIPCNDYNF